MLLTIIEITHISISEIPHLCDGKYRTLSGVLSKLLTARYGSEEREPHR